MPKHGKSHDHEDTNWASEGWELFAAIVLFLVFIVLLMFVFGSWGHRDCGWGVSIFLFLLVIAFLAVIWFLNPCVFRKMLYVIGFFIFIGILVAVWAFACGKHHSKK